MTDIQECVSINSWWALVFFFSALQLSRGTSTGLVRYSEPPKTENEVFLR